MNIKKTILAFISAIAIIISIPVLSVRGSTNESDESVSSEVETESFQSNIVHTNEMDYDSLVIYIEHLTNIENPNENDILQFRLAVEALSKEIVNLIEKDLSIDADDIDISYIRNLITDSHYDSDLKEESIQLLNSRFEEAIENYEQGIRTSKIQLMILGVILISAMVLSLLTPGGIIPFVISLILFLLTIVRLFTIG